MTTRQNRLVRECGFAAYFPTVWRLAWPLIAFNPAVLVREMRLHSRGVRLFRFAFWLVFLLSLATFLTVLRAVQDISELEGFQPFPLERWGRMGFGALAVAFYFVGAFLAPALTCTALSAERAKGTLESLQAAPLTGGEVILGKYLAAVAAVVMTLACTLPVAGVFFMLGGVSATQVLGAYGFIITSLLFFAAVGLFASAYARPVSAPVLAMLCALGTLGVPVLVSYLTEARLPGRLWQHPVNCALVFGAAAWIPSGVLGGIVANRLYGPRAVARAAVLGYLGPWAGFALLMWSLGMEQSKGGETLMVLHPGFVIWQLASGTRLSQWAPGIRLGAAICLSVAFYVLGSAILLALASAAFRPLRQGQKAPPDAGSSCRC